MTIIGRIGDQLVAKHGPVFVVLTSAGRDIETYTARGDAFGRALERADLVDGLAHLVRETRH